MVEDKSPNTPQQKQQLAIDAVQLATMIKSTIMALHHANHRNYSVVRDLGSPLFRQRFDPAKLAAAFADVRGRKITSIQSCS